MSWKAGEDDEEVSGFGSTGADEEVVGGFNGFNGQNSPHGSGTPTNASPQNPRKRFSKLETNVEDLESFRIEDGTESSASRPGALHGNILLENPETETRWYFKYFLGKTHSNFAAALSLDGGEYENVLLSYVVDSSSDQLRAILWRRTGSERLVSRASNKKTQDPKKIITDFGHGAPEKRIVEIRDSNALNDLLVLEEQEGAVSFKWGVLYGKKGQVTDDDMFSNKDPSPEFKAFYEALGTVSPLKDFNGYRGGLDNQTGSTGDQICHTVEFGKEIAFHVSTLLPHSGANKQQLERKRHLGNDICNIVYQEDPGTQFMPENIKSRFNHIFAVVSPSGTGYTLKVCTKNSVPEYGPPLPNPSFFASMVELRHFIIVKLLNGEKAALGSPISSFAIKKERTLGALIDSMCETYDSNKKSTLPRGTPKFKGKAGVEDFRSKGQSIKISKIGAGLAPTAGAGSIAVGAEPWTPVCITVALPATPYCGFPWSEYVLMADNKGVHRITVATHESGDLQLVTCIDSSILAVQLIVDDISGILFVRTSSKIDDADDAGKGGQIFAVPLDDLVHREKPMNKKDLKKFLVANTKGCHIMAVNHKRQSTASMLRKISKLAVGIGKKIRTFQFIPVNPAGVLGMGSGGAFLQIREFQLSDHIITLTLGCVAHPLLCAALRSGDFMMIDLDKNEVSALTIGRAMASRIEPVAFLQVGNPVESDETELVLAYNQAVVFKSTEGGDSRQYDIKWTSRPQHIAYVYPYLLGFTRETIEVVTMINGSLVKTLPMPNLQLIANHGGVFFTSTTARGTSLFKMSADTLSGKTSVDEEFGMSGSSQISGTANVFVRRLSSAGVGSRGSPLRPLSLIDDD